MGYLVYLTLNDLILIGLHEDFLVIESNHNITVWVNRFFNQVILIINTHPAIIKFSF